VADVQSAFDDIASTSAALRRQAGASTSGRAEPSGSKQQPQRRIRKPKQQRSTAEFLGSSSDFSVCGGIASDVLAFAADHAKRWESTAQ
jgi:hypothetical protein